MTEQWMRWVKVTVSGAGGSLTVNGGDRLTEHLKVDFSGQMGIGSAQNSGTVTIWNLARGNRGKLGEEFDTLKLEIGYRDAPPSILLTGDIRDVTHRLEGADCASEIVIGDGDKGVNTGASSKTFPAGTKPKEIIEYLQKQLPGVKPGRIVGLDEAPAYTRPITVYGTTKREFDKVGREQGAYWSIQRGTSEVVKADAYIDETVILSRDTGLIGSPAVTDKGVKVRCLINPKIAPNRVIDVRSAFLDETSGRSKEGSDQGGGLFRVASVSFSGTNRGQEFYQDIEGNRIQGGKVVK
jgi:hypothetical protein